MPYNGSGTYVDTNPPPFVFNTIISETQMNTALTDIANALSAVLVRDGQAAMTGGLNMGSQAIHTLGAGTAGTPTLRFTAGNGFYLSGTNEISLALGGTRQYTFTTSGFSGNFSIVNGRLIAAKDSQTSYDTGAIEARSGTGDVYLSLHAGGTSAAALKHTRGGTGISVVDTANALAPVTASMAFFPARPTFTATQSATQASTGRYVGFSEQLDRVANFDPSSGIFTAPVTSAYLFTFGVTAIHSASSTAEVWLNVAGANFCRVFYSINAGVSGLRIMGGGSIFVTVSAGSQVYLNNVDSTGAPTTLIDYFSGAFVG